MIQRRLPTSVIAMCLTLAVCVHACAQPVVPPTIDVPGVSGYVLDGDVLVLFAPQPDSMLLRLTMTFPGGTALDDADRAGLAEMLAMLVRRGGSGRMTAAGLDEHFVSMAARVTVETDAETTTATLECLGTVFNDAVVPFVDMLRRPAFEDARLDLVRATLHETRRRRQDDADAALDAAWRAAAFGTPLLTEASIDAITMDELRARQVVVLQPRGLVITVTGGFEPTMMLQTLDAALVQWTRVTPPAPPVRVPTLPEGGHQHVEMNIAWALARLGGTTPIGSPADGMTTAVLARILTRRLAGTATVTHRSGPQAEIHVDLCTPGPELEAALAAVRTTLADLITTPVSDLELQSVRDGLGARAALLGEDPMSRVGQLARGASLGRVAESPERIRALLAQVSAADVQRIASLMLSPAVTRTVTVGRATEIGVVDVDVGAASAAPE